MSPEPDPAAERPRPLLSVTFWVFMVFALLCILAGAGVVMLGPKLWPAPAPAVQPASKAPA